jgi:hypothetical protein
MYQVMTFHQVTSAAMPGSPGSTLRADRPLDVLFAEFEPADGSVLLLSLPVSLKALRFRSPS